MKRKQKVIINNIHSMNNEILKLDKVFKSKKIKTIVANISNQLELLAKEVKINYLEEKYDQLNKSIDISDFSSEKE